MKILIIHGPNMNLVGIQFMKENKRITLEKINTAIRNLAHKHNFDLKILQTHSQNKANKFLHSNRKLATGLLLCPQSWNNYGFIIKDTLDIINLPFVTIHFNNSHSIFNGNKIINNDPIKSYCLGLEKLIKEIIN